MVLTLLVPYSRGDVLNRLHESSAEIRSIEHAEDGTRVEAVVREDMAAELAPFAVDG